VTFYEFFDIRGALHGFRNSKVFHTPPYVNFDSCVFADGHCSDESVRVGDEPLLEVQRVVIEIHQLGHNFEGHEKIDGLPVPDGGSVLDQIRAWVGFEQFPEPRPEVVVEPCEVKLFEVFGVVHV